MSLSEENPRYKGWIVISAAHLQLGYRPEKGTSLT